MMKLSIHALAVETFVPMLRTVSQILDKGAAHAREKQIEVATLGDARLAPDMYPLARQVQLACHYAADAAARLTGGEPPPLDTGEESLDALKARIERTIADLQKVPATAFDGAEARVIAFPIDDERGFEMSGLQFLREWSLPHFYFHVVTAYDILRHQGVDIGKRDYMSHVGAYIRPRGKPQS
ncbi:MAG: DUF1993 domain-containing protein [Minicystis sp.]